MDRVAQRYGSLPSAIVGAEGLSALTLDLRCAEEGSHADRQTTTKARHDALRVSTLRRHG